MVTEETSGESPFTTVADANAETPEQRKALVGRILADVAHWKEHHKDAFKRMKRNVKFVKNAGNEQWRSSAGLAADDDRYVANITHRFIQMKVSSLYARDPRVKAKRRQMMDYQVWDGREETLQSAMATLGMAMSGPPKGPPPDPKVELEKGKLALSAEEAKATHQLAAEKQAAEIEDQRASRALEMQKQATEAKFKQQELDIRRQEIGLKSQEITLKRQEMAQAGRAMAVDSAHRVADRTAAATTAAFDRTHDAVSQQADHEHATDTAAQDRAHDADQQKRDHASRKAIAKKVKGPTNAAK